MVSQLEFICIFMTMHRDIMIYPLAPLVHFVGFPADILTVVGAVIVGYATCMLQQGFGSSFFSKTVSFASIGFIKTEISKL